MPVWNFVRHSVYHDSVTLMRLTHDMDAVAGVRRAAVMMGTPANRALLAQAGLLATDGEAAGPADLVIAVVADSAAAAETACAVAERALSQRSAPAIAGPPRPRTLAGGRRALPDATLALISVPGVYAGAEARRALEAGLHVMLFSDNVPLETEIELKQLARVRGLFVMGPDCGTAIVAGVPLGFANAVPRGRIGLVAASGTGAQEVSCRLAAEGEGVSHAIGVGGRDLSDAVGGTMTLAALTALGDDPATEVVVVIGKPPGGTVRARLAEALAGLGKPAVITFAGATATATGPSTPRAGLASPATTATLEDAALAAVALARGAAPRPVEFSRPAAEIERLVAAEAGTLTPGQRFVRGVYTGGTLAWEALALLAARLADVAPDVRGEGPGHRVVDLGDDRFTVGRPHPMIDATARHERIAREAGDPATAVLLLDVVLGYGAHADPAAALLPALREARRTATAAGRGLSVVASVTGTEHDPQVRSRQVAALQAAGVLVMDSNAQAARLAALVATRAGDREPAPASRPRAAMTGLLGTPPRVISVGLDLFARALERLDVPVVHLAWAPPAGGDPRLTALLERLQARAAAIEAANAEALGRIVSGEPVLVDCRPAWEALDLPEHVVLHAGPPLAWARMCEPMQAAVLCAIRYEDWAANDDAARRLVERRRVRLEPCHHWRAVGPMTGIITRSMPVFAVENRAWGNRAHVTINEGLGKVLRFGANDDSVIARLRWLAAEAGPLLGAAIRGAGGVPLRPLMAQALRMGDEMHQRNLAASALLARALMPHVARAGGRHHAVARLAEFIAGNDQFFLNVAMAAGKATADAAAGIADSSLVTALARNGTEFGIRVAALGDRWLTAPVDTPVGLYFPGFGPDDANPDMGDSAIVETIGLGGVAMAASPAVARFVGAGGMAEALAITEAMREITAGEHTHFRIPTLDDRGTPVGIDVRRVVETGITPLINTGIAGRRAGTGQVGAGVARAPLGCFTAALEALTEGGL